MRMPQEEESYLHGIWIKAAAISERISVEERWARRLGRRARAESSLLLKKTAKAGRDIQSVRYYTTVLRARIEQST
jgi:hypothetical protein